MYHRPSFLAMAGALLAMPMASVPGVPVEELYTPVVPKARGGSRRSSRRKVGKAYPFASKRQTARYARQIAVGQIRNAKAEA